MDTFISLLCERYKQSLLKLIIQYSSLLFPVASCRTDSSLLQPPVATLTANGLQRTSTTPSTQNNILLKNKLLNRSNRTPSRTEPNRTTRLPPLLPSHQPFQQASVTHVSGQQSVDVTPSKGNTSSNPSASRIRAFGVYMGPCYRDGSISKYFLKRARSLALARSELATSCALTAQIGLPEYPPTFALIFTLTHILHGLCHAVTYPFKHSHTISTIRTTYDQPACISKNQLRSLVALISILQPCVDLQCSVDLMIRTTFHFHWSDILIRVAQSDSMRGTKVVQMCFSSLLEYRSGT